MTAARTTYSAIAYATDINGKTHDMPGRPLPREEALERAVQLWRRGGLIRTANGYIAAEYIVSMNVRWQELE